jgi:hypothetical protein
VAATWCYRRTRRWKLAWAHRTRESTNIDAAPVEHLTNYNL